MKQPSGAYSNLFDDDDYTEEDQEMDADLQVTLPGFVYDLPCANRNSIKLA